MLQHSYIPTREQLNLFGEDVVLLCCEECREWTPVLVSNSETKKMVCQVCFEEEMP